MPALRQPPSRAGARLDLSPPRKPPPWMNTTSGVGLSDFAFHRSMTLRSCGPYLASATSGLGFSCWAKVGEGTIGTRYNAARTRTVRRFINVLRSRKGGGDGSQDPGRV